MDFTVEFYVSANGRVPVQEFLEDLKRTDPDDHAAVMRGMVKLRDRQYHREPLSKALGDALFELRHVGKLNTRVIWFFMKGCRIIAVHGIRNKGQSIPALICKPPKNGCKIGDNEVKKTNFDTYLEEQLQDPAFVERFDRAGDAWDVAIQLAALREKAGLTQKQLARMLKTSQQQVSRLESPAYEGHSLSMLRRVADALGVTLHVSFGPKEQSNAMALSDHKVSYKVRRK